MTETQRIDAVLDTLLRMRETLSDPDKWQRAENDHRALGATLADLLTLVETFEGKRR